MVFENKVLMTEFGSETGHGTQTWTA